MGWFDKESPGSVEVNGTALRCQICAGTRFNTRQAQLNTAAASLFNLDWANASATCHICAQCGFIHWFA